MAESRDSSLPGGMKDLIDLIKEGKQSEQASQKMEADVRAYCRNLAPAVFDTLAQQIDHDLLYTEDGELILPMLRDVACRTLRGTSVLLSRDEYSLWITDVLVEELWRLICLRRPFRNEA